MDAYPVRYQLRLLKFIDKKLELHSENVLAGWCFGYSYPSSETSSRSPTFILRDRGREVSIHGACLGQPWVRELRVGKGPHQPPHSMLRVLLPLFCFRCCFFFVGGDFFPAIFRQCSLIRPLVQVSLIKDARRKTYGKFLASVAPQRSFVSMRVFWNAELLRHSCLFLSVASFSGKESEHFFFMRNQQRIDSRNYRSKCRVVSRCTITLSQFKVKEQQEVLVVNTGKG